MKRILKTDLQIVYHGENCYRLSIRKKFLYFFSMWVPVTTQETENSEEEPIEFKTFDEAVNFINLIT